MHKAKRIKWQSPLLSNRLQLQISLIISHIKLILKALSEICHKSKKCRLHLINSIIKVSFIWLRNGIREYPMCRFDSYSAT